ncbi:phage integrase N-terminal SAM-like domain-containing protein [Leptothermofonsia sp. ETS-13]|uniref:phage integrase N-terminal SAM-like domain-containing protein n=1 Tax=Leptothermofonsia sp. ETS-13 TaxID=3035696 RepID=UPI003BA25E2F
MYYKYTVYLPVSCATTALKLLDQLRDEIRLRHYAYRTEETYVQWIRPYILWLC